MFLVFVIVIGLVLTAALVVACVAIVEAQKSFTAVPRASNGIEGVTTQSPSSDAPPGAAANLSVEKTFPAKRKPRRLKSMLP